MLSLIGKSEGFREVLRQIGLLKKQTHMNVLILGESGTGKELVARLLHHQEEDPERPFVVVNMPAIPKSLLESELFGVEKGAYTDAKIARPGKFELADGGDIFLDEIGDLPVETQAKMLRVLQERQIERIGSNRMSQVKFRVISATNRPLGYLMNNGHFRDDLMFRLADMVLWIPPLRSRLEDIPALCEYFIQKYIRHGPKPTMTDNALKKVVSYHWPGNVRQLESTIKRTLIFNAGTVIDQIEIYDPLMLNPNQAHYVEPGSGPTSDTYEQQMEQYERALFIRALQKHGGNKLAAIDELKISRATFYRKMQQLKVHI